jgi:hypothetical protein
VKKLTLELNAHYTTSMVRKLRLQLSKTQLRKVLSRLTAEENPLQIQAEELLEYINEEGPLTGYAPAKQEHMGFRDLLDVISRQACFMDVESELLDTYKLDDSDIQFATCVGASC